MIVALSLLSSAAMASAERAWVLWTHFTEAETGKPDRTTLDPTSAFESKTECDAAHSNIKGSNHQLQMEGATAMLQVTERARKSFKSTLEQLVEDPDAMLRIGRTDSGLGLFPDTQKDDDQVILHEGALCSSSTRKCQDARGHDHRRRGSCRRPTVRRPEMSTCEMSKRPHQRRPHED